ncbi:MAG: sterol desaturase family protein [Candidatus Binataceae bacterium]
MAAGYIAPLEESLPLEKRDQNRATALARLPDWYNPWLHFFVPSAFGLAVIVTAIAMLKNVTWLELLAIPITWIITNANEWRIHRDLLHRRFRPAAILYDRHTPEHHMIYVTDDMAMRNRREFALVLIPAYGLFLIFVTLLPVTALIWAAGFRNIALLYLATAMGFTVSYEWLHLSYHLPHDSRIGKLWLVRVLRRHHAIHHDPRLMQRYNFNVTVPFWDWVRGTMVTDRDEALASLRTDYAR